MTSFLTCSLLSHKGALHDLAETVRGNMHIKQLLCHKCLQDVAEALSSRANCLKRKVISDK